MKQILVHLFESFAPMGVLCLILWPASVMADTILPITLGESDKQPVNSPMIFTAGTLLLCEQGDRAIQTLPGYVCGTMTQGVVLPHAPSDIVMWTVAAGGGTTSLFCSDQDVSKGGDNDPACAGFVKTGLPTVGNFAIAEPLKDLGGAEMITYNPAVGNPGYGRFRIGSSDNFDLAQYTLISDPATLPSPAPEPSSLLLLGTGVLGLGMMAFRRKSALARPN